jgi:hypothetical protein
MKMKTIILTDADYVKRIEDLEYALRRARYVITICKDKMDPEGTGLWKSLDDIDEALA